MKALYCGGCGDLLGLQDEIRTCKCGRVRARWYDGSKGLAIYCETGAMGQAPDFAAGGLEPEFCWGIGLHNAVLWGAHEKPPRKPTPLEYRDWQQSDGYVFKQVESMVVRFRPGDTSDTRLVAIPQLIERVWPG